MLPYLLIFLVSSVAAIIRMPVTNMNRDGTRHINFGISWAAVYILLVTVIGFRFEVGGDWFTYIGYLERARWLDFSDLTEVADPGYIALNIISSRLGWGLTGVNVMAAAIFAAGLVAFLRTLPRPWLGLMVAIPYLVIVVAMGYTRQGIAIGLVMVALTSLRRERFLSFAAWVIIGALFHKSAVLVIPIAVLTSKGNRLRTVGLVGLLGYAAYDALLAQHADRLVDVYVYQEFTESQGALIRLMMNAVPAALFLHYGKRFIMTPLEYRLWQVMAILALMMLAVLWTIGFSTALDRMALYLIPLQLVVFSHLPDALGRRNGRIQVAVEATAIYYAVVLLVWLNFADHSQYWLPYRMGLYLN